MARQFTAESPLLRVQNLLGEGLHRLNVSLLSVTFTLCDRMCLGKLEALPLGGTPSDRVDFWMNHRIREANGCTG